MTSQSLIVTLVAAAAMLAPAAAGAVETSVEIELATDSDFERHVIVYDCAGDEPLTVHYINAAPNFLALVPIPEEPEARIFAAVISASGARYASGQWVWWSQGADASLFDVTLGEDAEAVLTCTEINNIP